MNMGKELAALGRMTVDELRTRYGEVFGEEPRSRHRQWLVKRIAWRIQALAEGGLSERARRRAAELANDADLRLTAPIATAVELPAPSQAGQPRTAVVKAHFSTDRRLPPPGTVLARPYKGQTLRVIVRADGFEYEGEAYNSLSAVAKAITGSHCNGYLFFGLTNGGSKR
jgi:hypothetical protein